jgi:drug/metabolite transporter (DMT)-like permease
MKNLVRRPQSYAAGVVLVVLATVGWSLSGMFVRFVPELNGWQINCWRGYWMSTCLLIYLTFRYGKDTAGAFSGIPRSALLAVALFFAVGSTAYVTSLTLTTVANVSSLGALSPIFTAFLGRAVIGEKVNAAAWLAAILALLGVAVVMSDGIANGYWIGNLIALFVALAFSGQTVFLRKFSGYDMVPAICLGGFTVFLIAGFLGNGFDVSPRSVLILAIMGPLQLGIPLVLFARGAASVPAITMSLIALLDVVLNPFWAWIGSGETPAWQTVFGAAIIVSAVMLSIVGGWWMTRRRAIPAE